MKKPYKLSGLIKTGAVVPGAAEPFSIDAIATPELEQNAVSETQAKGARNLVYLGINLIDPNPLAPREVYTPQMILARAEALRTQGQHDPIHVIPNPDEPGRFIICDGWTRVQACRDHQVTHELLAEVHEGMTLEESAWFGYQQNEEREQHCDLDRAMFYEKLIAAGETAAEVAKRAGVSRAQMTYYRSFARLPMDVMEIVRSNPRKFGATASYQLSKVVDRVGIRQAVRLAVRFSEEGHSNAWLVSQAQALIEPTTQKQPTASKHIRFNNGFYKQRGNDFEVSMSISDHEKRLKFALELEALLATVAEESNKGPDLSHEPIDQGDDS